jgi:hypothetical protein
MSGATILRTGWAALALVAALVLASCTAAQLQQARSDIGVGIEAACADVLAAQKLNPTSPVAAYATAACGTATAVAALAPSSATIQWLGQIQQQLSPPATAAPPAKA